MEHFFKMSDYHKPCCNSRNVGSYIRCSIGSFMFLLLGGGIIAGVLIGFVMASMSIHHRIGESQQHTCVNPMEGMVIAMAVPSTVVPIEWKLTTLDNQTCWTYYPPPTPTQLGSRRILYVSPNLQFCCFRPTTPWNPFWAIVGMIAFGCCLFPVFGIVFRCIGILLNSLLRTLAEETKNGSSDNQSLSNSETELISDRIVLSDV